MQDALTVPVNPDEPAVIKYSASSTFEQEAKRHEDRSNRLWVLGAKPGT
jgi:hypothetical protein